MTEATIVIKGRNELSAAVNSAERSLKGLLKQGELLGKLFRGGAIVGALVAFERLAENAERAAEKIGDKGTAGALRKLNKEIDTLKSKGVNIIGRVLGDTYVAVAGTELERLEVKVRNLRGTLTALREQYSATGGGLFGFQQANSRAAIFATESQLADAERRLNFLRQNRPFGERDRAPGSRGGGRAAVLTNAPKAGRVDPLDGLDEINVWQRQMFDLATLQEKAFKDLSATINEDVRASVQDLTNDTRKLELVIADNEQPFSQMAVFAEQTARNMQGIFANWFVEMDNGFKGLLGSFTDMLKQMVAQLLAQQLLTSFFSWGSGLGGGIGGFFTDLSKNFGGARASGGPVSAGRSYLVGERGPELFVPGMSGAIVPNGMGGVVVNNYVTINDDTDLRRSLPAILAETTRQSVAATKSEIRSDVKRYGKIR